MGGESRNTLDPEQPRVEYSGRMRISRWLVASRSGEQSVLRDDRKWTLSTRRSRANIAAAYPEFKRERRLGYLGDRFITPSRSRSKSAFRADFRLSFLQTASKLIDDSARHRRRARYPALPSRTGTTCAASDRRAIRMYRSGWY